MDETKLIAAAQQGDRNAFNDLVIQYQAMVYNVAYRILGDGDWAADAAQDAFISAFRHMAEFRGGSFKGWLLRIVTNACYDQLRAKKRRPTSPMEVVLDDDPIEISLRDTREPQPPEYIEQQELGQLIQRGLDTLPPDQRTVLVLADIQEMSYDEIAASLRISLGTVKSRLSRGRGRLRDFLQSHAELLPARYRLHREAGGAAGLALWVVEWLAARLSWRDENK